MASTLSNFRFDSEEEAEEEDEEEDGEITGLLCGCGDEEFIRLDEDVVCIHLAFPYSTPSGEILYNILQDDEGEPIVEPLFFRYECWENVGQELAEAVEDQPPQTESGSILTCDYCSSSIRMGEKCATVHLGEINVSERLESTTTFTSSDDDPYVICLPCVVLMANTEVDVFEAFQLWGGHVSQNDECSLCTQAHCWRIGKCSCKCHVVRR
jgi:hypothetical protein